jgi:hypothetical protein
MKHFVSLTAVLFALAPVFADATRNITAIVDVLAYNDVYEMLQDDVNGVKLGGSSQVTPLAKQMRAKNPNSLVLFAGDTMPCIGLSPNGCKASNRMVDFTASFKGS